MFPNKQNQPVIHFVHLSSGPGGIEVTLPWIIRNMPDRHFRVMVVREEKSEGNVYENMKLEVRHGSNMNWKACWKVYRYARVHHNDLFHVYNLGPLFLLFLQWGGAKNIIYSIHGTIYWKRPGMRKWLLQILWKWVNQRPIQYIANSQHSRSVFLEKIDGEQDIKVIYNPIPAERFSPSPDNRSNDKIRIIYAGRLDPGKNLQKWVSLAIEIHLVLPETIFELYGQGSLQHELQETINAAGANGYIQLKGFTKDLPQAYRSADLLLFLSDHESFGNVVVESVLCGTPVLCSAIPAMKEIFAEYPDFLLSDPGSWKEEIISRLNRLPELKDLAQQARAVFIDRFSPEQHIRNLETIYDQYQPVPKPDVPVREVIPTEA